jgi:hypothetical protein
MRLIMVTIGSCCYAADCEGSSLRCLFASGQPSLSSP